MPSRPTPRSFIRSTTLAGAVATIALVGAGCGKRDAGQGDRAKPTAAAATTEAPARAEVTKAPVTAAMFSKGIVPPDVFLGVTLGMPTAEANRLVPDNNFDEDLVPVEGGDAYWWASTDGATVMSVQLRFPVAAQGAVVEAWGPGVVSTAGPFVTQLWFNPEAHILASLSESTDHKTAELTFARYLPLREFLGPGPTIAFFDKPILGQAVADVERAYAAYVKRGELVLPLNETSHNATVRFEPADGSAPITEYSFEILYKWAPTQHGALVAAIEEKWGKGTPDEVDPSYTIYRAADPKIVVHDAAGRLRFMVTPR
ncbi:MAG: hypothetical protein R3B06_14415 [Kofleriaceae bacterium]